MQFLQRRQERRPLNTTRALTQVSCRSRPSATTLVPIPPAIEASLEKTLTAVYLDTPSSHSHDGQDEDWDPYRLVVEGIRSLEVESLHGDSGEWVQYAIPREDCIDRQFHK